MMLLAITALWSFPLVSSHKFRRSRMTVTRKRFSCTQPYPTTIKDRPLTGPPRLPAVRQVVHPPYAEKMMWRRFCVCIRMCIPFSCFTMMSLVLLYIRIALAILVYDLILIPLCILQTDPDTPLWKPLAPRTSVSKTLL